MEGSLGLGRQKPEKGRRDMELRKDKGRGPRKERMWGRAGEPGQGWDGWDGLRKSIR